jgi:hypothetical protein
MAGVFVEDVCQDGPACYMRSDRRNELEADFSVGNIEHVAGLMAS